MGVAAAAAAGGDLYWPRFCGNNTQYDAFWAPSLLSANTYQPDVTNCFQDTALVWLPAGYILVSGLVYALYPADTPLQVATKPRTLHTSTLCLLKLLGCVLLMLACTADLLYHAVEAALFYPVHFIAPVCRISGVTVAAVLTHYVFRRRRQATSGILWVYWALSATTGAVAIRTSLLQHSHHPQLQSVTSSGVWRLGLGCVYLVLAAGEFLLALFPDTQAEKANEKVSEESPIIPDTDSTVEGTDSPENLSPERTASFQSKLFFFWFTPKIIAGVRKSLKSKDVWAMDYEDSTECVSARINAAWQMEMLKLGETRQEQLSGLRALTDPSCRLPVPSLGRALAATFGVYVGLNSALFALYGLLGFLSALILGELLKYVDAPGETAGTGVAWEGALEVAGLSLLSVLLSIMYNQHNYMLMRLGKRLCTGLSGLIYQKMLRVSCLNTGELVTLVSVDTDTISLSLIGLEYIWYGMLMVLVGVAVLWQILGAAVLPGLVVIVVILPIISTIIGAQIRSIELDKMKLKDERMKLMNQIICGIQVVKLYAWELVYQEKVLRIRQKELALQRKAAILGAIDTIGWSAAPVLMAVLSIMTYALLSSDAGPGSGAELGADTVFVTITVINQFTPRLADIPNSIRYWIKTLVSVRRIEKFLLLPEIDEYDIKTNPMSPTAVAIENGSFSWGNMSGFTLTNLDIHIPRGRLVAVVGPLGSGKSSLIAALLNSMVRLQGDVTVNGTLGYVSQKPWIQNMSVRNNILFLRDYNKALYEEVVEACGLKLDLDTFPAGDSTEIGERGMTVSGGQAARLALARAVYADADLYLLDSPLAALDSATARHVFDEVIGPRGLLRFKTRLLVTHKHCFLSQVDHIIVMEEGRIIKQGSFEVLMQDSTDFRQWIDSSSNCTEPSSRSFSCEDELSKGNMDLSDGNKNSSDGSNKHSKEDEEFYNEEKEIPDSKSPKDVPGSSTMHVSEVDCNNGFVTTPEFMELGTMKLQTVVFYVRAVGITYSILCVLSVGMYVASHTAANIYLSHWSRHTTETATADGDNAQAAGVNGTEIHVFRERLSIYGSLGAFQVLVIGVLSVVTLGCLRAAKMLHTRMLTTVLRSPLGFFQTTPIGRITNRFAHDLDMCDVYMPLYSTLLLLRWSALASTLLIITYSTPLFILAVLPLAAFFVLLQRVYTSTSLQLQRLHATRMSSVLAFFTESALGVPTVRGAGAAACRVFTERAARLVDAAQQASLEVCIAVRWVGTASDFLGHFVLVFAGLFALLKKGTIEAGTVGLSLSFAIQINQLLGMCLITSADLERELVAVERIKEYCELPSEAPWCLDDVTSSSRSCDSPPPHRGAKHQPPSPDDSLHLIDSLNSNNNINSYEDIMPSDAEHLITANGADIMPYKNSASQDEVELLELSAISEGNTTPQRASWPSEGTVTWQGYSMRHRPGLKLVLRDLTCHIKAQEKVGVVGRTGAGKSSLGLGLLRAMEAAEGRVQVDGRDLTTVGLHQLRGSTAITIIPQDPFLFSGSLRFNLDPSNNHDDCEIWNALETVHLREYVTSLPGTLDFDCGENGVNFSVGQRQLVCMARALLRRPRILLLDEATAAVDADTDALIQGAIRTVAATSRCTVISIAHRLHTVMDCDRIMVINKGKIAEFDTPENLCQNVHSLFYQMAKDAGIL